MKRLFLIYLYLKIVLNVFVILELPKTRPEIRGGLPDNNYKPGDTLNLTCVSAPSNPPATLEWKLNGQSVSHHGLKRISL